MKYDELLDEANDMNLRVHESTMPVPFLKGLYVDGNIVISNDLKTISEKICVLAEEIGHAKYTVGDIIDQHDISNIKQEKLARNWAYDVLLPVSRLIDAYEENVKSRFELAEYLGITEDFIDDAIDHYLEKYGPIIEHEGYLVCFSPFGVLKKF